MRFSVFCLFLLILPTLGLAYPNERLTYRCFQGRHELNPHKDMFASFETLTHCPYWLKRLSTYDQPTTRYLLEAVIQKDQWLQCQYHHPDNKIDLITCRFQPQKISL